jgi:hypothetical protein
VAERDAHHAAKLRKVPEPTAPLSVYDALERLVADLETNSEAGAPEYAHRALEEADRAHA